MMMGGRRQYQCSSLIFSCFLCLLCLCITTHAWSRVNPSTHYYHVGVHNRYPMKLYQSQHDDSTEKEDSSSANNLEFIVADRTKEFRSSEFGDFIPLNNNVADKMDQTQAIIERNRLRNIVIAVSSFAFAIINYCWNFTHPVTALEILVAMEKQSAPLTSIGNNGKPTVIDFWAPWCSNCKVAAPTLQAVEKQYGDKVNFIMVNGDDGRNLPLIQLFGVDAIPHLALLSDEGDVETALIGPMSRNVLRADLDALLTKREGCGEVTPVCHEELPYKMYDAFGSRESRRINFQR